MEYSSISVNGTKQVWNWEDMDGVMSGLTDRVTGEEFKKGSLAGYWVTALHTTVHQEAPAALQHTVITTFSPPLSVSVSMTVNTVFASCLEGPAEVLQVMSYWGIRLCNYPPRTKKRTHTSSPVTCLVWVITSK